MHIYRLLKLTANIFVLAGAVLTVVGNTVSLNSCKMIAGPVLITLGGLFLLFFTVWHNFRQDLLPDKLGRS